MSNSPHRPDTANSLDTTRERRPGENFKHDYQRMMMEGRQREAIPPDRRMIGILAVKGQINWKPVPAPGGKDTAGQSPATASDKPTSASILGPNPPARWRRPLQALLRLIGLTRRNGQR